MGVMDSRLPATVGAEGDIGCVVSFPITDLRLDQALRAGDMLSIAIHQGLEAPATFDRVVESLGKTSKELAEVLSVLGQEIQRRPGVGRYNCLLGATTLGAALVEAGPVRANAPNLSLFDERNSLIPTLRLERQRGIRSALMGMPNYLALLDRHLGQRPVGRGCRLQALDTAAFALRLAGLQPIERS